MEKFCIEIKGEHLQYIPFSQMMRFENEEEYAKWIKAARKEKTKLTEEYRNLRGIL